MLLIILEILLLFVVPILLIYFKKINFRYRIHVLGLICIITMGIIIFEKWSLIDIGLRLDNIKSSLIPYLIFTLLCSGILILLAKLLKLKPYKNFYKENHFIFGFIILSLLQEFLFRSFLITKLSSFINSEILIILINAILFTIMHIIYFNKKLVLIILFCSGIAFAYLYMNYPNLILITISHSILNYIAVMYGLFSEEKIK